MTVVVGLLCKDGLVVASDSQESDDEVGMKRLDVMKVYGTDKFDFTDVEMILTGTGTSAHIGRAVEIISEKGYAPHFTLPRHVADIVEDSLGDMRDRYGEALEEDLELMIGVYCKNCPPAEEGEKPEPKLALYNIYAPGEEETQKVGVAERVEDYSAMGSGGLFARYLLNRLYDESHPTSALTMDEAVKEAVYVIEEVTKVDLWCGGPTQLICLTNDGKLERKQPAEILKIAAELTKLDQQVKESQRQLFSKQSASQKSKDQQ